MKQWLTNFLTHRRDLVQSLIVLAILFTFAVIFSPRTRGEYTYNLFGLSCTVEHWPIFLKIENLTDLLRANSPVAIIALGMTFVILTGGIDLSVGSTIALSAVVCATLLVEQQTSMATAMIASMVAGGLVGLVNGGLIALLRIQPFIITLATMIGIRGLARLVVNNEQIGLVGGQSDSAIHFAHIMSQKSVVIGAFLLLAIAFGLLLWGTVLGRYVRAMGDNARAAQYAGLPTRRVLAAVYTLTGLLAGVAGVFTCARTNNGNPNEGIAAELSVIAVVVIGGTSLAGGRGSVTGTVIGALVIAILTNILGLNNVDANVQSMIMALVIILAVVAQTISLGAVTRWWRQWRGSTTN
ncbi:MAG: ABC transporter permease [Phycisphaeraceae bacterium]|nr:ABC transporter permease [Phycisphaeraceae bacterium]